MKYKTRPPIKRVSSDQGLALVLLSGGIDSTACLSFYHDQKQVIEALFIDYGQPAALKELRAASSVCDFYGVPLLKIKCDGARTKCDGFILGRNAFLLYLALMEFHSTHGIIAIGIHSGTIYYDCSEMFLSSAQAVFDTYANGAIRIGSPFINWMKSDIVAFCKQKGVPLELTYSCEFGLDQPCGRCPSCRELEALNART